MHRLQLLPLFLLTTTGLLAQERPSFVWLVSEDNSKHHLRMFDAAGAPTPRIEALAREGLVFEHAFSNSPVCSVARTTLMTGCHAPRIGTMNHRRAVPAPMPEGLRMFPAYLRKAGYHTTNNRKKDYNAVEGEGVWDASSRRASWRGRKAGQPFFHMQSFPVTHEGSLHFGERAMRAQKTETDPASVSVAPYHPDTETFRHTYARYHDRIRAMDAQIGAVVDLLVADGLLESTFVFYFGDHGGVLPRGKGYAYESGLHVPLVVRVPERFAALVPAARGARVGGFVSFVDFGPTLLRLAGVPTPPGMDGRAFLGKGVTKDELASRDEAFGYADRFDEKYDIVRTLRKGRFKYMRSYQPFNFDGLQNNYRYRMLAYAEWRRLHRAGKLNAVQRQFFEPRPPEALYDLVADPHETRNLAAAPAHRSTLLDLRQRLRRWVVANGDLGLYPESYLIEKVMADPVGFGAAHSVAPLVAAADWSLVPFGEAEAALRKALGAADPWVRYWGLIACSTHGEAASSLASVARALVAKDPERMIRVRAAEFLGVAGAGDPAVALVRELEATTSAVEASLILNTIVLLRDGARGYRFEIDPTKVVGGGGRRSNVQRRLDYLAR